MKDCRGTRSGPRGRDGRNEMKEFFVMVAMGLPGMGLLGLGLKMFQWAGHVTAPGLALACAGACLVLATGFYHYRKDYREKEGGGGLVLFLLLTVVPGFVGVLVVRLLVRN